MTEQLKQKINDEMAKLPKVTQEAISSLNWEKIVENIGTKYQLEESEINNLQVETFLVMFGYTEPDLFAKCIEEEVDMSTSDAKAISDEMLEKIFTPIMQKMESALKTSLKTKKPTWDQTVRFILLGGNYSVFIEK